MLGYATTSLGWPDPPLGPPPRNEWVPAQPAPSPGMEGAAEPQGQPDFPGVIALLDGNAAMLEGVLNRVRG